MTLTIGIHGIPDRTGQGRSHDHGIAVMRNGRVLWACELERLTRRKHAGDLPLHLEQLLLPWLAEGEPVRLALANGFLGNKLDSPGGGLCLEGPDVLEVEQAFAECGGQQRIAPHTPTQFFVVAHEAAHVGTCISMFGAPAPNSLLFHVDGGASRSNVSVWHFDGAKFRCLQHAWDPRLKGAVNNFNDSALTRAVLGLFADDHLAMPGKLMGLASFGVADASAMAALAREDWIRDGRRMMERVRSCGVRPPVRELDPRDPGCQVLAACIQRELEDAVLELVRRHVHATGAKHVFYSGGAALNVHANTRLERALGDITLMAPCAPSDAGLAIGAAAILEWQLDGMATAHAPFQNFQAPGQSLWASDISGSIVRNVHEVAEVIARGGVVACVYGNGELGPRALGHRSLLCRADRVDLRVRVSERMKNREWYRPVAPLMGERGATLLLAPDAAKSALAPYMLGAWQVSQEGRQHLAGAVHVDGSVRAQVVRSGTKGLEHIEELLDVLETRHGLPALINTSFNRHGEPIVHTLEDATSAAREMGVEALWLP